MSKINRSSASLHTQRTAEVEEVRPAKATSNITAKTVAKPDQMDRTASARASATTATQGVRNAGDSAPVSGTLHFGGNWDESVDGSVRAGSKFVIDYDPARAKLHNSHNGFPAWGVTAYVQFSPSGKIVEVPAITFESVYGHPTNTAIPAKPAVLVPADAQSVAIWFRNYTTCDHPAEEFDSNFSKNYCFDVK
jgi:hypothetical protein